MRIITSQELDQEPKLYDEIADVLHDDGLVCFPGHNHYSIAASLLSTDAVIALVQSKRRSGKAPSLILIPDSSMLARVAQQVPEETLALAEAFWPGPLTVLLQLSSNLPSKVRKTLAPKKQTHVGIRVPGPGHQLEIVRRFDGPLLISSANISHKVGATSASKVRKSFNHTVDLMIDAGDVAEGPPSTIVDLTSGTAQVTRVGQIPQAAVQDALATVGSGAR